RTTRKRRGRGMAASALTTRGTLPKGSITRINKMVAESSSDCIVSAVFSRKTPKYIVSPKRGKRKELGDARRSKKSGQRDGSRVSAASRGAPCGGAGNGRRCRTRHEHSRVSRAGAA